MSPPPLRTSTSSFQVGSGAFVGPFFAPPAKPPSNATPRAASRAMPAAALMMRSCERRGLLLVELRGDRHRTRFSFCVRVGHPPPEVAGHVDVARTAEVVACDQHGRQRAGAFVRNSGPGDAVEHDGVAAIALVD